MVLPKTLISIYTANKVNLYGFKFKTLRFFAKVIQDIWPYFCLMFINVVRI